MLAMGLLMDPLEALGLLEADPARLGGSDEAHLANKKYAPLVDPFPLDALQFVRQGFRSGIAQKGGKGGRIGPRLGDACSSAITSVAASSTTPKPSCSNWRRTAVLPAPGGPVRMNRFIQNRSISPPSGSFRNFRKRYANLP
jgi:hypothetical protein